MEQVFSNDTSSAALLINDRYDQILGPRVTLSQLAGAMNFSFGMFPAQARELAVAIADAADRAEEAANLAFKSTAHTLAASQHLGHPVIIYGPNGCGKTLHAAEIAQFYGKTNIVDGWEWDQPIPDNALILTSDERLKNVVSLVRENKPTAFVFDFNVTLKIVQRVNALVQTSAQEVSQ
jgi:hypothetical protein